MLPVILASPFLAGREAEIGSGFARRNRLYNAIDFFSISALNPLPNPAGRV
ncbi:MAG: hypothetical protein HQ498_11430 [Pseudohongiella sp.]|jgi:hypothetical protein|nr:hypothetical protein [Pseudohongiella sp.]